MLKMLIVEDEFPVRNGLKNFIDWSKHNITIVGEASNGKEALEYVEKFPVDIVLTDVVMPVMTGIELVNKMHEMKINAKVVFISGYTDIDFLKSAFQLEVIDYIFKPVSLLELEEVFNRISGIFVREDEQRRSLDEIKRKLRESLPVLKEKYIIRLLNGEENDLESISQKLVYLEFPFKPASYFVVVTLGVIGFAEEHQHDQYPGNDYLLFGITEKISQHIEKPYSIFYTATNDTIAVIISSDFEMEQAQIFQIAEMIKLEAENFSKGKATIGIGNVIDDIRNLFISYRESIRAFEQKFFFCQDQIIHISDIVNSGFHLDMQVERSKERIADILASGKEDELLVEIDKLFTQFYLNPDAGIEYVKAVCIELYLISKRRLAELKLYKKQENDKQENDKQENNSLLFEALFKLNNIEETRSWTKKFLLEVAQSISEIIKGSPRKIIDLMVKCIEEKYKDDISIRTLADEFLVTPNYVCYLFKKETGLTVVEYLTRVRITAAKQLLENPRYKMYEISEKVGYKDVEYFSKIFKKLTGQTLSAYRENMKGV